MESVGAAYPHPDHVLLHLAGTHLVGAGLLYDDVDAWERLGQTFAAGEAGGIRPETVIFTGNHAGKGKPESYRKIRGAAGNVGAEAGLQGRDGARSCNPACLHGRAVMNSVVPVGSYPPAASGTCTGNPPGTGNFPEGTTE